MENKHGQETETLKLSKMRLDFSRGNSVRPADTRGYGRCERWADAASDQTCRSCIAGSVGSSGVTLVDWSTLLSDSLPETLTNPPKSDPLPRLRVFLSHTSGPNDPLL